MEKFIVTVLDIVAPLTFTLVCLSVCPASTTMGRIWWNFVKVLELDPIDLLKFHKNRSRLNAQRRKQTGSETQNVKRAQRVMIKTYQHTH